MTDVKEPSVGGKLDDECIRVSQTATSFLDGWSFSNGRAELIEVIVDMTW